MTTFKRALIALDLTHNDEALLSYAGFISKPLHTESAYFMHIIPDFTQPDKIETDPEFQKIIRPEFPVDEQVKERLVKEVETCFGKHPEIKTQVEVIEGKPYQKLLHWVDVKNIELLMAGQKKVNQGSGIAVKRVARNAACNVLFVPETAKPEIHEIIVPVDFSDNSSRALRVALDLKKTLPGVTVTTVHIVPQPAAVYYAPEFNDPRFAKLLMQTARESHITFLEKNRLQSGDIKEVFIEDSYANIPRHVAEFAGSGKFDLMIIGATGHSAFNQLFFSSVTESVVERCREMPILVVR